MSKSTLLYLDFEFSQVSEELVNLVSCSTLDSNGEKRNWWLHKDLSEQLRLKSYLNQFKTFIAYSAIAECRSFLSLGLMPTDFEWVDLFVEYRCLTNHNDELQWGKQLVDGKVKMVFKPRPKWERVEGESQNSFSATHSLAEASYKLIGVIRDTEHKTKMRDLIISDPDFFTLSEMDSIISYGEEDVKDLPLMYSKMKELYFKLDPSLEPVQLFKEMKLRGKYSALTSIMESRGYPIDIEKTLNFSRHTLHILFECQREINELFPEIKPFIWDRLHNRYKWNQKATREWVIKYHSDKTWMETDTGNISLALEAFEKYFPFKHDYPKDNFGAQIVRYLKLKQNLYGFVPTINSTKKTFWDYVGKDKRVRPYMNIFKAQSSRSQPAATGFMFLKPAWMRALVIPEKGKAMAGVDFGSQEFFIAALESNDQNMIESYLSGDVYLSFAKLSEMVPKDGIRKDYEPERDLCKSTVLGISYLMTKYGLAIKLTNDSGRPWSEFEAQEMIDKFYEAYPDLAEYQANLISDYKYNGHIKLPCGWYLFGDNENFRSVSNVPIQGKASSIMRKAVEMAFSKGLYVCFTLHDALYIEYNVGEEHKILTLMDCMREATAFYYKGELKEIARKVKLDPFAWSRDYPENSKLQVNGSQIPCSNIYLDKRAKNEYALFKKYFEAIEEDEL